MEEGQPESTPDAGVPLGGAGRIPGVEYPPLSAPTNPPTLPAPGAGRRRRRSAVRRLHTPRPLPRTDPCQHRGSARRKSRRRQTRGRPERRSRGTGQEPVPGEHGQARNLPQPLRQLEAPRRLLEVVVSEGQMVPSRPARSGCGCRTARRTGLRAQVGIDRGALPRKGGACCAIMGQVHWIDRPVTSRQPCHRIEQATAHEKPCQELVSQAAHNSYHLKVKIFTVVRRLSDLAKSEALYWSGTFAQPS